MGAMIAEMNEAPRAQIQPAGHWNATEKDDSSNALTDHYLTGLPRGFIRSQAGHPPTKSFVFHGRALVEPPRELVEKVFPPVEACLRWEELPTELSIPGRGNAFSDQAQACRSSEPKQLDDDEDKEDEDGGRGNVGPQGRQAQVKEAMRPATVRRVQVPDHNKLGKRKDAARAVAMIAYLRTILLQDMALLAVDYPDHFLNNNPLFCSPAFKKLAEAVRAKAEVAVDPASNYVQQTSSRW